MSEHVCDCVCVCVEINTPLYVLYNNRFTFIFFPPTPSDFELCQGGQTISNWFRYCLALAWDTFKSNLWYSLVRWSSSTSLESNLNAVFVDIIPIYAKLAQYTKSALQTGFWFGSATCWIICRWAQPRSVCHHVMKVTVNCIYSTLYTPSTGIKPHSIVTFSWFIYL